MYVYSYARAARFCLRIDFCAKQQKSQYLISNINIYHKLLVSPLSTIFKCQRIDLTIFFGVYLLCCSPERRLNPKHRGHNPRRCTASMWCGQDVLEVPVRRRWRATVGLSVDCTDGTFYLCIWNQTPKCTIYKHLQIFHCALTLVVQWPLFCQKHMQINQTNMDKKKDIIELSSDHFHLKVPPDRGFD